VAAEDGTDSLTANAADDQALFGVAEKFPGPIHRSAITDFDLFSVGVFDVNLETQVPVVGASACTLVVNTQLRFEDSWLNGSSSARSSSGFAFTSRKSVSEIVRRRRAGMNRFLHGEREDFRFWLWQWMATGVSPRLVRALSS
jgi:hypothetical protein